jgi:hypothetical protein
MKSKLILFLPCLVLMLLLASCGKEYSTEYGKVTAGTNSGTAVYTYAGAPNCTGSNVQGSFSANAITTISNAVTLQVNVTTPGTFIISTATINGIAFKGTGTFSLAGIQNLNLMATGTPLVAGTFSYISGATGCTFDVVVLPGTAGSTSVFTFPDAPLNCTNFTVSGTYQAGTALTSANLINGIQVNVSKAGTWFLSTLPNNGITFSGSGTFTTTGLQTISLTGNGTPITSGPFNYSPGNNGCSFTVAVVPAIPLPADFVKCKIDGVSTIFGSNAYYREVSTPAQPPVPATNSIDIVADVSATSNESIELTVTKTSTIVSGDVFDANGLVRGMIYSAAYTNDAQMNWSAVSGVSVTPFTITITSKTATRIQGTFNGTVSDTGMAGGTTKIISEGSFSLPVH